jgi:hypothetical protein
VSLKLTRGFSEVDVMEVGTANETTAGLQLASETTTREECDVTRPVENTHAFVFRFVVSENMQVRDWSMIS